MKKYKLSKKQLLSALVSNYQELEAIFASVELKKLKDASERKKRILEDLEYLIDNGFGFKMTSDSIRDLFNSID